MRLIIISCCSQKLTGSHPAELLYISDLFNKAKAYSKKMVADGLADKWMILSAKYGLIEPEMIISDYDITVKELTKLEYRNWYARVYGKLSAEFNNCDDKNVATTCGKSYRAVLQDWCDYNGASMEVLLDGKGIGQQKKWLVEALRICSNGDSKVNVL